MKLRYIDAIRGIAILMVIIVHTSHHGSRDYPTLFKAFVGFGAKGVQLFFLASAFTLYLSHKFHSEKEKYVNTNFFIRRFFRIAPMYYLGILYFSYVHGFDSIGIIFSNFFFLHGVNPYWINSLVPGGWSITVEMTFYLFFPLLFSKIKSLDQAIKFTIGTLFLSIILRFIISVEFITDPPRILSEFLYYFFPNQLPIFCLGIVAYFLIIENDKKIKNPIGIVVSSITLLATIGMLRTFYNVDLPNHFISSLFFVVLFLILSKKEFPIIVNNFTCYFGKISFSGYLIHFAVLGVLSKYKMVTYLTENSPSDTVINYLIRLALVLAITALISTIFYLTVEVPFQKIGKNITLRNESGKSFYAKRIFLGNGKK